MVINYESLALLVSAASIVAGLIAMWVEGRRTRVVSQATLSVSLEERFNGPETRSFRRAAAQKLKVKRTGAVIIELNETLDFFALVAALVDAHAIEPELTYRLYSYWWVRYWRAGRSYVEWYRKTCEDPRAWNSVEHLSYTMERQMVKLGEPMPTETELERFLDEEACC